MLVPYKCCTKSFEDYYVGQTGNGLPYYQGISLQKGYGIGGFFAKLFRSVLPFLKSGAKAIGKEALRTGTMIANDVLAGENVNISAKTRAKEAGKVLARKALKKADEMIGHGRFKRKRKSAKHLIRSKIRKVQRRDIFDS
jgi:hypothetical protein